MYNNCLESHVLGMQLNITPRPHSRVLIGTKLNNLVIYRDIVAAMAGKFFVWFLGVSSPSQILESMPLKGHPSLCTMSPKPILVEFRNEIQLHHIHVVLLSEQLFDL